MIVQREKVWGEKLSVAVPSAALVCGSFVYDSELIVGRLHYTLYVRGASELIPHT